MSGNKDNIDNLEFPLDESSLKNFDAEKLIKYWIESSDEDYVAMLDMFKSKHFNWSLFLGHLVIEKLLKAYFIKTNQHFPPLTHNLLRLAEKSKIELNDERNEFFSSLTTFNINARYDDYKQSFGKICTQVFTQTWIEKIEENRKWIREQLLK